MARFGSSGIRRFMVGNIGPDAGRIPLLVECGIPRQVGPYFLSSESDSLRLGAYHGTADTDDTGGKASWLCLGRDQGAQLCLDPSGKVRAEFDASGDPGALVNGSLDAFLESLIALDEALALIGATRNVPERATHIRTLLRRLAVIEQGAVQSPDSWWSRVVEDIRHTSSHASFAAFEFTDAEGKKQIVSEPGGMCLHPEERIWNGLREAGVTPAQVKKVHTELEPCFMPGHYCTVWMAREFPHAEFTHSFGYGQTAQSREASFLALLRQAAVK
ncbi:MAG: SUKH-4 family immunity protein [Streptomycetaceae bacterium]|nr:SUKH-4 family immunity protein [Streptomycetaceae bacterium]